MAQFSVHRNKNPRTRAEIPLLLNVQSDLLDHLDTRVVIPLAKAKAFGGPPSDILKPRFEVGGEQVLLLTPLIAGISRKDLGVEAGSLRHRQHEIVAAIDLLISGV